MGRKYRDEDLPDFPKKPHEPLTGWADFFVRIAMLWLSLMWMKGCVQQGWLGG